MAYKRIAKVCLTCADEFQALPKHKFCSVKCSAAKINSGKRPIYRIRIGDTYQHFNTAEPGSGHPSQDRP